MIQLFSLNQQQIPVKVPAEGVGKNLQNHPVIFMNWDVKNDTTHQYLSDISIGSVKEYIRTQQGMWRHNIFTTQTHTHTHIYIYIHIYI